MYLKSDENPFPMSEFQQTRLWVTFESFEDFKVFVSVIAKSGNHFWGKRLSNLKNIYDTCMKLWGDFAISANGIKPLSNLKRKELHNLHLYGEYFYTYRELLTANILYNAGYDYFEPIKKNDDKKHLWGKLVKIDKSHLKDGVYEKGEEILIPIDIFGGCFMVGTIKGNIFFKYLKYKLDELSHFLKMDETLKKPLPVLDEDEKKWLDDFRNLFKGASFVSVTKHTDTSNRDGVSKSYLSMVYDENGERRGLMLPSFPTKQMYKGMAPNRVYSFDELLSEKG